MRIKLSIFLFAFALGCKPPSQDSLRNVMVAEAQPRREAYIWRTAPPNMNILVLKREICVGETGVILGEVIKFTDGDIHAFVRGAFCESGIGFVSFKTAKDCIGRTFTVVAKNFKTPASEPEEK